MTLVAIGHALLSVVETTWHYGYDSSTPPSYCICVRFSRQCTRNVTVGHACNATLLVQSSKLWTPALAPGTWTRRSVWLHHPQVLFYYVCTFTNECSSEDFNHWMYSIWSWDKPK